jgi:signal transduction histidine kinase
VGKVLDENSNLDTRADLRLERRAFDLWPLVEGVIQDVHPIAGTASTRITNEVPDDLVVFADAGVLRRVFQNIIANAIAYTPRGEVRIGAQERAAGGAVECWVSDTGTGIPADRRDQVFAKGAGDPAKEGSTGLGLAIVKTFVEAHHGTVRLESEEGHGTTIRFTLPPAATASAGGKDAP